MIKMTKFSNQISIYTNLSKVQNLKLEVLKLIIINYYSIIYNICINGDESSLIHGSLSIHNLASRAQNSIFYVFWIALIAFYSKINYLPITINVEVV